MCPLARVPGAWPRHVPDRHELHDLEERLAHVGRVIDGEEPAPPEPEDDDPGVSPPDMPRV